MKRSLVRVLVPMLILAAALAFVLALAPSEAGHAHSAPSAQVDRAPLVPHQPATPTPDQQARSQPGSTDGIMIMSLAIVVIIAVPILLQRALWGK